MAIYAQFDKDGACIQIATGHGYSEYGDWVETLEGKPNISEFWETGACENIADLRSELKSQLDEAPPENQDVLDIALGIISAIDAAGPAEIILVTQGIQVDPDDDQDSTES